MQFIHKLSQLTINTPDRLMALMILSLHALLLWGDTKPLYAALLLCHYGFFLLWQPVMRPSDKLSWPVALIIGLGAGFSIALMNWWITAFWIAGLFALIGGRVVSNEPSRRRLPNLLAATYLIAILLLWVVPKLLGNQDDLAAAEFVLRYFLPLLPLAILFLSTRNTPNDLTPNIDFFYTLLLFLLTVILILGSYAIGVIWQIHYIKLLMFAVSGLALTLVALSWLWNPSATFSGLELLMSRYLLSIGLPFEHWIRNIATLAEQAESAEAFLTAAMQALVQLNWVSGVTWHTQTSAHTLGETTHFVSTYRFQQLHLTLYSRWQFTPAMYLHVQLLTQILGEFYEAKLREETIRQNMYMQSLYETGSRLTHDIKNILQSLGTLSAAMEQNQDAESDAKLVALVKKQLPRLSQRLSSTLGKLEKPNLEKPSLDNISLEKSGLVQQNRAPLATWWHHFQQLNAHHDIHFETPEPLPSTEIDPDVLDSVVDNLIQNALRKAKLAQNVVITVSIMPSAHFCIEVTDTGAAMSEQTANKLFKSHVSSNNGLGVGLYHAAQQAAQAGYALTLQDNVDGEVRFRLEKLKG